MQCTICQFSCEYTDTFENKYSVIRNHLRIAHAIYNNRVLYNIIWKCSLCKQEIRHYDNIRDHLFDEHLKEIT